MNIIRTRRLTQGFFLLLLVWFCIVSTVGERWHQLRGWPINWLLDLDPLVGLGTLLSTGHLYAGLVWGVLTLGLTVLLGRFFCGWVCPLGTLQQLTGWLSRKSGRLSQRRAVNQYHPAQQLKYYLLFALLGGSVLGLLETGLLDPIPLVHRSLNLVVLGAAAGGGRFYAGIGSVALVFLALLGSCLWVPRFYCRFICPLGALFGLLVRWTPWRVGKRQSECNECGLCEGDCEGACEPFGKIRLSECVLCLNCLKACRQGHMTYGSRRSAAGEVPAPKVSRRGFLVSAVAGLGTVPVLSLGGVLERNWRAGVLRPPGALAETEFLERCIKCGQCMRVCPTNTVQPALGQAGWEGLWTPVLNFRAGTSGCQLNCIACGNVCPTAALRPISLDEKLGRGAFAQAGPLRLGTAFVDRSRCLPWAMDTPCIVCQENCPVSPKAIFLREEFQAIREGTRTVQAVSGSTVKLDAMPWPAGTLGGGSYYVRFGKTEGEGGSDTRQRYLVSDNSDAGLKLAQGHGGAQVPSAGTRAFIEVALQKPFIDPARCIGCGICEHECPVSGLRAIRVTAENESRSRGHSLLTQA